MVEKKWKEEEVWHVHTAIFKIDNQQGPTVKKKIKIKIKKTKNTKRVSKVL